MDIGIVFILLYSVYLGYSNGIKNIKAARCGITTTKSYNNLFDFIFDIG